MRIFLPTRPEWMTRFLAAGTLAWLMLSGMLLLVTDSRGFAIFGFGLLSVVAITVLAGPTPRIGVALAVLTALVFVGIQFTRPGTLSSYALALLVSLVSFSGLAVLGSLVARSITTMARQLAQNSRLIDELSSRDPETGALKRHHADAVLLEEIDRSRRYNHVLTLLIVGFDNWTEIQRDRGFDHASTLLAETSAVLLRHVRTSDTVARHAETEFAVLLPETGMEGAQVTSQKLQSLIYAQVNVRPRVGLAEYPNDAITGELLIREAESALAFARSADLPVASRSLLT